MYLILSLSFNYIFIYRKVFPEPPLIAFRRCKNLKDILVRARLSNEGNGGTDKQGCSRCGNLVVKCVMS